MASNVPKINPQDLSSPAMEPEKVRSLAYGEDNPLADYNQGIETKLNELEDRYNKPNWFNIAAGFAKPQLGGFTASLGSAAEAYGNQIEQQKQLAIPLFKMRAELGANSQILNRERQVNDEIQAWYQDPKHAGQLPPDKQAADWRARAPNATGVKSLDTQVGLQQKTREQAQNAIKMMRERNETPSEELLHAAGVPAPQKATNPSDTEKKPVESSALPLDPRDVKPGEKVNWGFATVSPDAASTPLGSQKIERDEKSAEEELKAISTFGNPTQNHLYRQNIDQLLDFAQKGPKEQEALKKVTNVMGTNNSLLTAISAAAEAGIHGNFGSLQATLGLPVKEFLSNFNDPTERKAAQMLMLALDNANYAQAKMRGMSNTANLPVAEANILASGLFSRDLNYQSLMHGLLHLDNNLNMYKNIYEGHRTLRNQYADQLSPFAPDYQIYKSDWMNNLVNHHTKRAEDISRIYNENLL